jgi:hypothetical protein
MYDLFSGIKKRVDNQHALPRHVETFFCWANPGTSYFLYFFLILIEMHCKIHDNLIIIQFSIIVK